jgi:hypothetical protein
LENTLIVLRRVGKGLKGRIGNCTIKYGQQGIKNKRRKG